jgi:hypothetical protein
MPPYFGNASGARFAKKRRDRSAAQTPGCKDMVLSFDPICQRVALFVAATKHLAATSMAIFSEFVETFVSLTHTRRSFPWFESYQAASASL